MASHSTTATAPGLYLGSRAPEFALIFFGTGFIGREGRILTITTCATLVEDDELAAVLARGLIPPIAELTAYFPDATAGFPSHFQ